jgi:hypothetical protein
MAPKQPKQPKQPKTTTKTVRDPAPPRDVGVAAAFCHVFADGKKESALLNVVDWLRVATDAAIYEVAATDWKCSSKNREQAKKIQAILGNSGVQVVPASSATVVETRLVIARDDAITWMEQFRPGLLPKLGEIQDGTKHTVEDLADGEFSPSAR